MKFDCYFHLCTISPNVNYLFISDHGGDDMKQSYLTEFNSMNGRWTKKTYSSAV